MKIILKENVDGLGKIGDLVTVKPGYGRNYLVPRGMALQADPRNVNELQHQKRQLERKMQKVLQATELLKGEVEKVSCEFTLRASEEGNA